MGLGWAVTSTPVHTFTHSGERFGAFSCHSVKFSPKDDFFSPPFLAVRSNPLRKKNIHCHPIILFNGPQWIHLTIKTMSSFFFFLFYFCKLFINVLSSYVDFNLDGIHLKKCNLSRVAELINHKNKSMRLPSAWWNYILVIYLLVVIVSKGWT